MIERMWAAVVCALLLLGFLLCLVVADVLIKWKNQELQELRDLQVRYERVIRDHDDIVRTLMDEIGKLRLELVEFPRPRD